MSLGPNPGSTVPDVLVIESCHSTWLFDTERRQFRRVLKGLNLDVEEASTAWRPYYRLDLDSRSDSFMVIVEPTGSRALRAWRHVAGCPHCAGDVTAELPLSELRTPASG